MTTHIHTIDDGARVTVSEHDGLVSLLVDHGHLALAAYLTAAQARTVAATITAYADALDGEDPEIRAATGGSGDETGAPAPVQPGNGTGPHSARTDAELWRLFRPLVAETRLIDAKLHLSPEVFAAWDRWRGEGVDGAELLRRVQ